MIKGLETERLTLSVCPEIGLKSVGVDHWNVGLNGVER